MPQTAPDPGAGASGFDLDGIKVESHVRQALEASGRFSGPAGIDGRAVLLACVDLSGRLRSRAFTRLAELLGPRAADVAKDAAKGAAKSDAPPRGGPVPPTAPLAESFARHREALVDSGFWGRDLVTLALLAALDPSLARLVSETGIDLEAVRRSWFTFLAEAGEHRTPEAWAAWWDAEGLRPPDLFPPVQQKTAQQKADLEVQGPADPDAGADEGALKGGLDADLSATETDTGEATSASVPEHDDFDQPHWLERLTPAAREVLASAWGLVSASPDAGWELGTAHLLAALATGPEGILEPVLRRVGMTPERFLGALTDTDAKPFPPSWSPMPTETFPHLARDAREAFVVAFTRAGADAVDTTHVAEGALSVPRSPAVVRLRALGLTRGALPWAAPLPILQAGYRSDSASGEDRLGVLREARTLAAVMASTAVDPPLSIGLFGPWGSGKSFFMRLLQEEVRRLSASGSGGYCRNVVQIRFNAWHYIDGNLWASLASEVFEQLGREVEARERSARGEEAGVQRARLLMAARQSRGALEEAEARRVSLTADLERARAEVETLRGEHWRERAATSSPRVAREAIERLGTESGRVLRADVHRALERLGLPADDLDPENVRRALSRPMRTLVAWGQALRRSSPRQWLYLAVGLLVAFVVAWRGGAWMAALGGALGKVLAGIPLVVGAFPALHAWYGRVRAVLGEVKPVAEEFERFAGQVRTQLEEEERARVELVLKQLDTAKQREEAARARLGAVEEELATLFKAERLSAFVQERRKSRYYEAQLGVIAQARQDFEQLSRLLHTHEGSGEATITITDSDLAAEAEIAALRDGMPEVDRIVLYIDDLDRCPESQVVDVLQAVHLLLAFPLFVVVVGVDPRWLIHSLADRSEVFRAAETPLEGDGDGRRHWRSTPLDYLEKIFQIPFHLRPMGETGFGDLIDDVTRDGGSTGAAAGAGVAEGDRDGEAQDASAAEQAGPAAAFPQAPLAPDTDAPEAADADAPVGDAPVGDAKVGDAAGPGAGDAAEERHGGDRAAAPVPEAQLSIEPWERTFMKALYPFITSPRAVKRYVNVYRLIRAAHIAPTLGPLSEEEVERDPSTRDDHRTVLLLLAMLTGYPPQAIAFFRWIVEDDAGGGWSARLEALRQAVAADREAGRPAGVGAPVSPLPPEDADARDADARDAEPTDSEPTDAEPSDAEAKEAAPEPAAPEPAAPEHTAPEPADARGPQLPDALPTSEWAPFLSALERGMLELAERGIDFEPTLADMREWIPFVARYAFVSGQALRDA